MDCALVCTQWRTSAMGIKNYYLNNNEDSTNIGNGDLIVVIWIFPFVFFLFPKLEIAVCEFMELLCYLPIFSLSVYLVGAIEYKGNSFHSISSFALAVIRERNPGRRSCDGWKDVKWKGQRLEALRDQYFRRWHRGNQQVVRCNWHSWNIQIRDSMPSM